MGPWATRDLWVDQTGNRLCGSSWAFSDWTSPAKYNLHCSWVEWSHLELPEKASRGTQGRLLGFWSWSYWGSDALLHSNWKRNICSVWGYSNIFKCFWKRSSWVFYIVISGKLTVLDHCHEHTKARTHSGRGNYWFSGKIPCKPCYCSKHHLRPWEKHFEVTWYPRKNGINEACFWNNLINSWAKKHALRGYITSLITHKPLEKLRGMMNCWRLSRG